MRRLTVRERKIMEAFDFTEEEAFVGWVEEGCPLWEGSPDSSDLIWDEGWRRETAEDRERRRVAAAEAKRRYEAGEMDPIEAMMYRSMQDYADIMLRQLFTDPLVVSVSEAGIAGE